ncbi:PRD domain-containing protein [Bacillus sp. sid0103]|uniref:PRD domain-containing protein n=1 Tax=Bacillus sp. sid0103 TaxID=2856337 RepID=UPI001C484EA0|nr:PRD domain-containing protein [Bacillus sp. sid0103]MBV7509463.1 PRD domain-containing protein [Bacillus sp. sid0103]
MTILTERLDILFMSDTITENAKKVCERTIEKFVAPEEEEKHAMLITHLAMAVTRIEKGEELHSPSEVIMNEVTQSPYFSQAQENVAWVESVLEGELPNEERQYLLMHFVSVLNS